jgi:Ca-activated chloride channel family protein
MNATHTDLRAGVRTDITVDFVTRRTIDSGGTTVHRLLVEDATGTQFAVLVDPTSGLLAGLKTGATYHLSGLLGSEPSEAPQPADPDCPDCGTDLRNGVAADTIDPAITAATTELDVDTRFGIIDERTTVTRERGDTDADEDEAGVDDWRPRTDEPAQDAITPPDFVCTQCQRPVDARELRFEGESVPDDAFHEIQHNVAADATNAAPAPASADTVGLAAGGAKDVANFRENVASGFTPQPEAISDEGLFYDYYFDTGTGTETDALFAPRYAAAASDHPVTGETQQVLSVGLDSTLAVEDFQRPRLDLVAVLDVSGSMTSEFDAYYYDEHGRRREAEGDATTKLDAATQSLCALTEQLHDEDRLGVVLYNHRAHVAKPLRDVGATDMNAIRRHIQDVAAGGSTNLADGFEAALEMLADTNRERTGSQPGRESGSENGIGGGSGGGRADVERRVVFMTDMMPNTGTTGESDLTRLFEDAANDGIHTTFVGMGLDENAELADALSGIRGANHYFVQSASEFERRLGEEFDYMVTPLVYDLSLELDTEGYEITRVHGSPAAGDATSRLMHVETLFPSAKQDGQARGGVVLVEVDQTERDGALSLEASWTERDGSTHTERLTVDVPAEPETFAHDGIRKAVALARYASELRAWTQDVHDRASTAGGVDDWLLPDARGEHERESVPLVVPDEYAERFRTLRTYLDAEMDVLGDETLQQELDLLETLCWEQPTRPREVTE